MLVDQHLISCGVTKRKIIIKMYLVIIERQNNRMEFKCTFDRFCYTLFCKLINPLTDIKLVEHNINPLQS